MTYPHGILAEISKDETLLKQLRAGDLSAFEKLNLRFDELYLSATGEEDSWADCTTGPGCNISVGGEEDGVGASATGCNVTLVPG